MEKPKLNLRWKLERLLYLKFGIRKPSELRRLLLERANYVVSVQTAANLLRGPVSELRIDTLQALCDACNVNAFEIFDLRPADVAEITVRLEEPTTGPYRPRGGPGGVEEQEGGFYPDLDLFIYKMEEADEEDPGRDAGTSSKKAAQQGVK